MCLVNDALNIYLYHVEKGFCSVSKKRSALSFNLWEHECKNEQGWYYLDTNNETRMFFLHQLCSLFWLRMKYWFPLLLFHGMWRFRCEINSTKRRKHKRIGVFDWVYDEYLCVYRISSGRYVALRLPHSTFISTLLYQSRTLHWNICIYIYINRFHTIEHDHTREKFR